MGGGDPSGALRGIRTLFSDGMLGGLTDRQLLERFVNRNDSSAESAFTILLERHGPMVWGVCRRLLPDRYAAADAFQATFLVLVGRASAVRVDDSLGPWLHGVSRRVAARARATSLRRRARETGWVEAVAGPAPDPDRAERLAILDEEIGRLPERQRAAVVLCDLEGLPHEEAARRLGCPVGTVESRLSRGRQRLRDRLVRRGLAPAAAALWAEMAREASAAMPAALLRHSARFVMSSPAAGAVPAAVTALAEGVIRMMWLTRLKPLVAVAAALILTTAGVAVQGRQQPAPEGPRKQAPAQGVDRPARAANGKTVSPPKPTYIEVRSVLSSAEKQTIPPVRVVNYGLKYQDFDRLMAAVTTVTRAVPIRELPRQIRHQGHAIECRVVGTTHDYAAVTGLEMDRGRFLTDADNAAAQNHVVVSSEVAQALFPEEDPVGKSVKVGTDYYTVVGVVKQANDLKDNVYMPLMTCRLRFGERIVDNRSGKLEAVETQLSRLILEVRDGADVEATAALVKSTLQPHHPKGDVEVVILKPDRKTR